MKQSEQTARSTRQERMETMRRTFLESTVRVVAQYGLERTTTKLISAEANLNEAYIYRKRTSASFSSCGKRCR